MYILQHLICFFLIEAFLKLPDLLGNPLYLDGSSFDLTPCAFCIYHHEEFWRQYSL